VSPRSAPGSERLVLAATILGSAVVFIDSTVVNVALPALRSDLGATLAEQQWVVEAYLLMLGSLVLVGGSLGDLYGRRRIFTLGLAGFGIASGLCAIAPGATLLVAARALQGVAGALLVPSSLAILTTTFPAGRRAAAVGTWTAWTSAMIALGPPLGGLLIDLSSWRAVFIINIPLVAACLALTARALPPDAGQAQAPAGPRRRIDLLGAALCALGLGGPVYALTRQPAVGWDSPEVLIAGVGGLVLLVAFVVHEARDPDPMLPLGVFRSRAVAVGNAATLLIYAGMGAATFLLALFLQQVAGWGALEAGVAFTPLSLLMITLSRRFGALSERLGPRALLGTGPLVAGAGLLLMLRIDADASYVTQVLPAVVTFGLGMAMTVAPLTATVLAGASSAHAGVASGVNNAVARIAGLLAIAVVGAVTAAAYADDLATRLPPDAAADVLADARRTPFVPIPGHEQASDAASVVALHHGMALAAALVLLAGVLSLAGLRRPPRPVSAR
jgi:EmrB/QacA subfamily drug resistance transporter